MGRTATLTRKSKLTPMRAKAASAGRNGRSHSANGHRPSALGHARKASGTVRTYRAALEYLGSLPNFERRPLTARDRGIFTLSRIKRLLAELDNPQKLFRSVHIAGTKGKGSTAAMLSNMLQGNHLKVGMYT